MSRLYCKKIVKAVLSPINERIDTFLLNHLLKIPFKKTFIMLNRKDVEKIIKTLEGLHKTSPQLAERILAKRILAKWPFEGIISGTKSLYDNKILIINKNNSNELFKETLKSKSQAKKVVYVADLEKGIVYAPSLPFWLDYHVDFAYELILYGINILEFRNGEFWLKDHYAAFLLIENSDGKIYIAKGCSLCNNYQPKLNEQQKTKLKELLESFGLQVKYYENK